MAKGSKSKKSKTQKAKAKAKKITKKKISEQIENKVLKSESIIKKEDKKETKEAVKETKIKKNKKDAVKPIKDISEKEKRINKKRKKKIIIILVVTIVLTVLLVLLIVANKNSYIKNTSFITKNSMTVSNYDETFNAPVYSFAVDKKDNPIDVENLKFQDKDISYRFHDMKRDELDDDNVLFTIPCDMEVDIEYVVGDDVDTNWIYTYSYSPVFSFDYYSGDIYHENTISDSKLVLLDEGKEKKDNKNKKNSTKKETVEDKMAYTEQVYNDEKISIGILNNSSKSSWGSNIYLGNKMDGKHFKVNNKSTTIIYIKAPKKYDGVALAINKNGSNYDTWKKEYDFYSRLVSLQEDAKKTGKKSSELEKIENEKESIHKLLDIKDELRKEYTKDDFYVIRIADMFKDNYMIKEESDINLLYVTGILVLSLSVLTCIFMIIGEANKIYGRKREYYNR